MKNPTYNTLERLASPGRSEDSVTWLMSLPEEELKDKLDEMTRHSSGELGTIPRTYYDYCYLVLHLKQAKVRI